VMACGPHCRKVAHQVQMDTTAAVLGQEAPRIAPLPNRRSTEPPLLVWKRTKERVRSGARAVVWVDGL
jgi:hypothetical protein